MLPKEKVKTKPKSSLDFRIMSLSYKLRDLLLPPMSILKEAGISMGDHVLDYGCGQGSYIVPLAELVGESSKIYALDIHPIAIQSVQKIASQKRLKNVQTVLSDCNTGLPSGSVDVVLLYDILHDLNDASKILAELHRVLKQKGMLSLSDHHMKEEEIISKIISGGLFELSQKGKKTCSFLRE